ncbi:MAG: DUF1285 domain-containing protein [Pseudomonadota bacterium]|nr:DUF1285 domain-containing protein [Pseudomonadota bacterium]
MSQGQDEKNTIQGMPTGLSQILAQADQARTRALPPLDKWNPSYCGEMDLRIAANGEWWHEGIRMTRQKLVDLFATVLWREDDRYFLKTPVEKIGIQVEDVPLLVTQVEQIEADGQTWIQCQTKTGDTVFADAEHPIFMRAYQGEMRPYILIRRNLEALIHRNAFYHLLNMADLLEQAGQPIMRLYSGGQVFELSHTAE